MRRDYEPYFYKLKDSLAGLGAVCVAKSDWTAEFAFPSGWLLRFECERFYGPSWDLRLTPPDRGAEYSLWILMEVFRSLTGMSYGPATIGNQIAFMAAEAERLFGDIGFYAAKYDALNSA